MNESELPAPVPLSPNDELQAKRKLLLRIAADSTPLHVTQLPSEDGWQPLFDGVRIKVLHESEGDVLSYLLRLAPGAELPAHRHPVDEECVVLEGEVQIGALRLGPGGFHLGRQDVLHDRLRSDGGALVFLRGAAPDVSQLI